MSSRSTVHECPPRGESLTPCCGRAPTDLPDDDRITTVVWQVTCRVRAYAELQVDTDRGESPFGWSDDPETAVTTLTRTLRAVRRQCVDWTRPTAARTWDSRVRDRSIGLAARIVVDTIDTLAPGIGDEDDDQAAIKPQLKDHITSVLLMTTRGDAGDAGLTSPHGEGGHVFDGRCALCCGDVEALADALLHAFTATVLPASPAVRLRELP